MMSSKYKNTTIDVSGMFKDFTIQHLKQISEFWKSNKYQEALIKLVSHNYSTRDEKNEYIKTLQEIVNKEAPMKVKYLSDDFLLEPYNVKCPYCDYILGKDFIPTNEREKTYHQYCCRCGQKLDWSDDGE